MIVRLVEEHCVGLAIRGRHASNRKKHARRVYGNLGRS